MGCPSVLQSYRRDGIVSLDVVGMCVHVSECFCIQDSNVFCATVKQATKFAVLHHETGTRRISDAALFGPLTSWFKFDARTKYTYVHVRIYIYIYTHGIYKYMSVLVCRQECRYNLV